MATLRSHSPTPAPGPDWAWERRLVAEGWALVAGVDEAGRGPLAGPVVAAAVLLPLGIELPDLHDSKRLSETVRERLYQRVTREAVSWAVARVEPDEIDRINILCATHLAMANALAQLDPGPHGALVDGLPVKGLPCPHRAVVKGDALCMSIAAASILAKVSRDRWMVELDAQYPGYGFARNKGYGSERHRKALRELGPTPCHRRSFRPVAEAHAVMGLPLEW